MGKVQVCTPPWGLTCPQDIFQQMMDHILECCKGAIGITDDGKDNEEDNGNLHRFMHIAHEHGLVFNGEKCEVKQDSVTSFSTVYDTDRAHPKKVDAVHQMPSLETPSQLQVFGNGHLSLSIHPMTLYTHSTTTGTAEKGFRVHTEHFLPGSLQQDQGIGLQGYNSLLL